MRGAGDRARSLKVKGEEIYRIIQLATYLDRDAAGEGVLDMVYCLCRHRSTGNDSRSVVSS